VRRFFSDENYLFLSSENNKLFNRIKRTIMAKGQDAKKNVKKEPLKTAKEKKEEKREKKAKNKS
jgi:hypothetical protein